jgi:hypothetical protein
MTDRNTTYSDESVQVITSASQEEQEKLLDQLREEQHEGVVVLLDAHIEKHLI